MSFLLCLHLVQGSRFRVQGSRGGFAAFFYWAMPGSGIQVTSHSYDRREGIGSHVWCQILRLSPHLFWLGLFTHRAFSSAQDDDTRGADGFLSERYVACFGTSGVIYDTSRPLETEVPQRDFRVWPNPKRRLACPLRRLPVRPNGPRRRRRIECLEEAQLHEAV